MLAALAELTAAAGVGGMVGGQYIDVTATGDLDAADLRRLHELKTGRLIGASVDVRTAAEWLRRTCHNRRTAGSLRSWASCSRSSTTSST